MPRTPRKDGRTTELRVNKLKECAWGCPVARPTSSPLLGEGCGLAQLLLLLVIRKATIGNGRRKSRGGRECAHEACVSAEPTANTRTPRRSFRFKQRPRSNRRDPFSRRHLSLSLSRLEPVETTIAHTRRKTNPCSLYVSYLARVFPIL